MRRRGRLIVVAVLDNLLKGAAGQAVQSSTCCAASRKPGSAVTAGARAREVRRRTRGDAGTARRAWRRRSAALAATGPLVVVHGGGREIDAELARRGVAKQAVDGLRITDAATLEAVVAVLGGTINTRLVAHLVGLGIKAVGLTGVDAALGRATRAAAHVDGGGSQVDLGLVGEPEAAADLGLVAHLLAGGYVPVIASLGVPRGRRAERQRRHARRARAAAARRP